MKHVILALLMLLVLIIANGCGKQIQVDDGIKEKPFDPNAMCASDYRCIPYCEDVWNHCMDNNMDPVWCADVKQDCMERTAGQILDWFNVPWPI